MPKPLELSGLTILSKSNVGNFTTILEGITYCILINVKGEVSNKDGKTPLVFDRWCACFHDGSGIGVFDAEPASAKVGSILFHGGGAAGGI